MNLNEMWTGIITVLVAIVGVATVAVLVSKNAQTGTVIGAAAKGFAQDLQAATGPVLGSTGTGVPPIFNY